jgi:hypothetical protein
MHPSYVFFPVEKLRYPHVNVYMYVEEPPLFVDHVPNPFNHRWFSHDFPHLSVNERNPAPVDR